MNPIPVETRNRWRGRAEPAHGEGAIYWHMLFRDHLSVRVTGMTAQARLAGFSDLHLTPEEWLHATALVAGTTEDTTHADLDLMLSEAQREVSDVQPISVSVSKVLYHPEAIMLGFDPDGALDPIHHAVRQATAAVTRRAPTFTGPATLWTPHMSIAYSTGNQPMGPIVAALGHEVPRCDITVTDVSLVIQWGPERLWNWEPVGAVHLGSSVAPR